MRWHERPYLAFFGFAVGVFAVATFGFGVLTRVAVAREDLWHAASQHLHYAGTQAIGTLLLFLPFFLLALLSAATARRKGYDRGLMVFVTGAVLLGLLFLNGYYDAQHALQQKHWTAAALSEGLLPVMSVPVLAVCVVVSLVLKRRLPEPKT